MWSIWYENIHFFVGYEVLTANCFDPEDEDNMFLRNVWLSQTTRRHDLESRDLSFIDISLRWISAGIGKRMVGIVRYGVLSLLAGAHRSHRLHTPGAPGAETTEEARSVDVNMECKLRVCMCAHARVCVGRK
jgi:hypothetical protein